MKRGKFLPLVLTSFLMYNCASVSNFLDYRKREFALEETRKIKLIDEGKTKDGKLIDRWNTPQEIEKEWEGDCSARSPYLHYLLLKDGIKSQLIYGRRTSSSKIHHMWVELEKNGEWYVFDPTERLYKKRKEIGQSEYIPSYSDYALNKFADYVKRIQQKDKNITADDVNSFYNYLINQRKKRQ